MRHVCSRKTKELDLGNLKETPVLDLNRSGHHVPNTEKEMWPV